MAKVVFNGSKSFAHNLNDLRERWHIRREDPIKYKVPVTLFKQDISKMQKEDLLSLLSEIRSLKTVVRSTLEAMKLNWMRGTEKHTDSEYLDVYHTDKAIGAHIEEINFAISRLNKQYWKELNNNFLDVCHERLSKELFSEIMEEARKRVDNKE